MNHFEPPIKWSDYEDIAMKLYERFGDAFDEGKIYRIRFADLLEWVLQYLILREGGKKVMRATWK